MMDHSVRKPVLPPSPDAEFAGVLPVELIDNMRRGIPASIIAALATRFGISQDQLIDTLRLPRSSLKARINRNEKLSPLEQDRLYRADRIWSRALDVLDDSQAAQIWIQQGNRSLGGEAPLALLDTQVGYELVLNTLGQIEFGVVA